LPIGGIDRFTQMTDFTKIEIAAIVVAFQPVDAQINRLIALLAKECRVVYVMDNGGGREAIASTHLSTVHIIDMRGNRGLGAALNLGFKLARSSGLAYAATFDQDSDPPPGLTSGLAMAMGQLASNVKVAAVGPRIVDCRNAKRIDYAFMRRLAGWPMVVKCHDRSAFVEADFLITSGCLIPLPVYDCVGPFDETLFVDYTDMEWCFRARALGYRLYGVCSAIMPHELGAGGNARVLGVTVLEHSPVRRYYYARNVVRLLKLSHVAVGWKARMLLGLMARVLLLPIAARFRNGWTKDWRMLMSGIGDGIAGAGGAYH
jgi:rhamnosyltransferase